MTDKQRTYAKLLQDELKRRGHNGQIDWTESNAAGDDEKTQLGWNFEFRRVTAEG